MALSKCKLNPAFGCPKGCAGSLRILVSTVGVLLLLFQFNQCSATGGEPKTLVLPSILERRMAELSLPPTVDGLHRLIDTHVPDTHAVEGYERVINQFSNAGFKERESAVHLAVRAGHRILPALVEQSKQNADPEVRKRCRECILTITRGGDFQVFADVNSAIVLLAEHGDTKSPELLLRAMRWMNDSTFQTNIWRTVERIASEKGIQSKDFTSNLQNPAPSIRALSAFILIRYGNHTDSAAAVQLLQDRSSVVRLRVAQALLSKGDAQAIPTLVELLKDDSFAIVLQAEELLRWLYGAAAPDVIVQEKSANRIKLCADKWHSIVADKPTPAGLRKETRQSPPLLVVISDSDRLGSYSAEAICGSDGQKRWHSRFPQSRLEGLDADEGLLMTEWTGREPNYAYRLVERGFDREDRWGSPLIRVDPVGLKLFPRRVCSLMGYFFVSVDESGVRVITRHNEEVTNWKVNAETTTPRIEPEGFIHGRLQYAKYEGQGRNMKLVDRPLYDIWSGKIVSYRQDSERITSHSLFGRIQDEFVFDRHNGNWRYFDRSATWSIKLPKSRAIRDLFPLLSVGFMSRDL